MANEITIIVKSRNEAKPGMEQAARDTDRLTARAKELGDEFRRTSMVTDEFGHRLHGTGTFADFLGAKIAKARAEAQRLTEEFQHGGDANLVEKIFGRLDEGRELAKIRDRIVSALGDAGQQGGQELGKNLSASFQGAESTPMLGPAIAGAIGAAIVAGGPLIMAAISGVVVAGIGTGAIAAGIAGQFQDPQVHQAVAQLGSDLKGRLETDTVAFKAPLLAALHDLEGPLDRLLGRLGSSRLAGALEPLARGVGAMLDKMGPGLSKLLDAAGPMLEAVASELPRLGAAIGDLFTSLSKGEGGAQALRTLIQLTGGLLVMLGRFIAVGSEVYSVEVQIADGITGWANAITRGIPIIGPFFDRLHQAWADIDGKGIPTMGGLGRALDDVGAAAAVAGSRTSSTFDELMAKITNVNLGLDGLAAAMAQRMFNSFMSVDQAALGFAESLTRLHDVIAENGRQLDIHTAKGQANREAILAAVTANMQAYQAWIQAGGKAEDAARQYDINTRAIHDQLRALGWNEKAIDGVIGKYKNIPDAVNPVASAMGNVADKIDNLVSSIRKLMGLPSSKEINVRVTTTYVSVGESGAPHPHAAGGIAAGLSRVAEQGRELARLPGGQMVMLPPGSQVYSNPDTERMLSTASGGSGGFTMIRAGDALMAAFIEHVQRYVRGAGGDGRTLGIRTVTA